jgi:predicted membrane channel-forming protein YqfA (hemolysin III family)
MEDVSFWLFWVFAAGAVLFLPGVVIYVWDFFFGIHPATSASESLV